MERKMTALLASAAFTSPHVSPKQPLENEKRYLIHSNYSYIQYIKQSNIYSSSSRTLYAG